jgi:hypothetical protein
MWATLAQTSWRQGPSRIEVKVHDWGVECGEQPRSESRRGGAKVHVQARAPHVEIAAPEHLLRTDRCWSDNHALRLVDVEARPPVWRTTCATDESDARGERGRYELRLTGGTGARERGAGGSRPKLVATAVHEYRWRLRGSVCSLTVRSHETFVAVTPPPERVAPRAPESSPSPEPLGTPEMADASTTTEALPSASGPAPMDSGDTPRPAHRDPKPPWALLAFLALAGTCVVAWAWHRSGYRAGYRARRRRNTSDATRADETERG